MMSSRKQILWMMLVLLCMQVSNASALTIATRFIGGAPPANAAGGGNLEEIVNTAAAIWESAYPDKITLTLYYGWAEVGDAGNHTLQATDNEGREITGTILFDNSGTSPFYLDPTPEFNEEYRRKIEESQDLGGGPVNVARIFSNPIGDAVGRVDLLSVALHEIGHALGLSAAGERFLRESAEGNILISEELPFGGSLIPLALNNSGIIAHFDPSLVAYGSVMSGVNADERRIPSELDVLANAQVNGFSIATLNPQQALMDGLAQIRGSDGVNSRTGSIGGSRIALRTSVIGRSRAGR